MRIFAVIPVRPPGEGKSRLEALLDRSARAALTRMMFTRVLNAALDAALDGVIVISRDPAILRSASAAGAYVLEETGAGLNDALAAGRDTAMTRAADGLLILPADLPLVDSADVDALVAAIGEPPAVVIAPDGKDAGTNGLLLSPPGAIPFGFGEASFARHLSAARTAGIEPVVLRRPHLGFDIDTVDDLAALKALDSGAMSPFGPGSR